MNSAAKEHESNAGDESEYIKSIIRDETDDKFK